MAFVGYVKKLKLEALKNKTISIPSGIPMRVFGAPGLDLQRLLSEAQQEIDRNSGVLSARHLEIMKESNFGMHFIKCEKHMVSPDSFQVSGAHIMNGVLAEKEMYDALFGDKNHLLEEVDDHYVICNPTVVFNIGGNVETNYMVDINDVPDIVEGKVKVFKAQRQKRKTKTAVVDSISEQAASVHLKMRS